MIIVQKGWSEGFDGPGTRLIYYLKGCNFRCDWCASPESISGKPEILYTRARFNGVNCCPHGALSAGGSLARGQCRDCKTRECVNVWRHPAFELAGISISPQEILREALAASIFISGVTFGGGEPTLHGDELISALALLREAGIHTAVESNASTETYRLLPGRLDLLFSDLKTLSPRIYRERIGGDGRLVADNLRFAAERQEDFCVRIPVVRGVNDSPAEQKALAAFCAELRALRPDGNLKVELLKQHHLGSAKYRALGRDYPLEEVRVPDESILEAFAEAFRKHGMTPVING